MINLSNKCVLVRTQEEYASILKEARKQGYRWYCGKEAYPFENQQIPDILKFYKENKELTRNASLTPGYELVEASDVTEDEKKLREAIAHVKYFANNKYRMSLTDKVIESMLLLANAVESQLEEVK